MNETKRWIRVVRGDDIPLREGRAVTLGDREIAIFNLGDRFLAIENRCPHRDGPLADGIVSGLTIVCPLHAWKFSLETGAGGNSASQSSCVDTFATRVEDGIVWVEIPVVYPHRDNRAERLSEPAGCVLVELPIEEVGA